MACVLHQLNDFQGERNLLKLSVLFKMLRPRGRPLYDEKDGES